MSRPHLSGLILASALITLDGSATTIALPAIGQDLSTSIFRLQWISNAPLVVLAAMLLPAGTVADRFGRVRVTRAGLIAFTLGAVACVLAPSDLTLIGAKFVQGVGGALILPAALALLSAAYTDPVERARIFGWSAVATGVASAAGPLLAGALVDVTSWRVVFATSAGAGLVALLLVTRGVAHDEPKSTERIPVAAFVWLTVLLGATAYLLMIFGSGNAPRWHIALSAAVALAAAVVLVRHPKCHRLFPGELIRAHNCLPANASTFALYFGLFGLAFLVALYTQQGLGYSALRAALVLLPVSIMLFLAERLGRLAERVGTRVLIVAGTLCAAAGLYWMGAGPHPLAFWSRMIAGTAIFGLGISLTVSALTHAAVAAVPETHAGAASGLNHAVARAAGLISIALLGSLAAPGLSNAISAEGFGRAMMICAAVVAAGGLAGSVWLRDEAPGGLTKAV